MPLSGKPVRDAEATTGRIEKCVMRLADGDTTARDELVALAVDRMQGMAHRMLRRFPTVRRWDETGDVVQNASVRLYKTLANLTPHDARGFLGLAAVHVRRELLDLARKYRGPESDAANRETNYFHADGKTYAKVDHAVQSSEVPDDLDRWERLHESAERLPDEEKHLFHLAWYLGLTQAECASAIGCSVRTIKRRWEDIKRLLRDDFDHDSPAGQPDG